MIFDNRPPRGGWAPGGHYRTCLKCLNTYLGSQSSLRCADCAYASQPYIPPTTEERIKAMEDHIKRLEDAGNSVASALNRSWNGTPRCTAKEAVEAIVQWSKAREAKL